jgi:septal ring factor EnvC (AmiA/AmiB activator)
MQERLHFMPPVNHYSITLPAFVATKLQEEAEREKTKRSTLIAHHLEQHYNTVPTAQYEFKIQELEKQVQEYEGIIQDLQTEAAEQITRVQKEASETAALEVKQLKRTLNQQASQSTARMQEFKNEMQLSQAENAAQNEKLKNEAAQNAASQDLVIKGLQNERENAQKDVKSLSETIVNNAGTINELKADKEYFKKQLELVTLRLPPPRVGFWVRLFGSKKEDNG